MPPNLVTVPQVTDAAAISSPAGVDNACFVSPVFHLPDTDAAMQRTCADERGHSEAESESRSEASAAANTIPLDIGQIESSHQ